LTSTGNARSIVRHRLEVEHVFGARLPLEDAVLDLQAVAVTRPRASQRGSTTTPMIISLSALQTHSWHCFVSTRMISAQRRRSSTTPSRTLSALKTHSHHCFVSTRMISAQCTQVVHTACAFGGIWRFPVYTEAPGCRSDPRSKEGADVFWWNATVIMVIRMCSVPPCLCLSWLAHLRRSPL
jgi:hypothetical protein